ncbi:MAG: hypothetical protein KF819_37390 [Labilithrix sp.]|nr:hypothetical protein [Labilithrix sp.]
MRRSLAKPLATFALAVALTAPSAARATDTSTAEHLFSEGLAAMKREDFKAACDAFGGSNEADPSPGTQINLALCNEKQGKLASAWGWYRTAAGLADQRGQRERAELARVEASKLEPRLQKLVINMKAPAEGMTVTRNGAAVPAAVVGKDVPVDPGEHTIEVMAKGKKPWKQTVMVVAKTPPGAPVAVDVPLLENAQEEAAPLALTPPPPVEGGGGGTQRTVGLVLGGSGIVAGVVAGVYAAFTLSEEKERQDQQAKALAETDPGRRKAFQDSADDHESKGKTNQVAAIIFGATGAALLGVGIILLVTAPSSKSAAADKTYIVPIIGHGTGGIGLGGTF